MLLKEKRFKIGKDTLNELKSFEPFVKTKCADAK